MNRTTHRTLLGAAAALVLACAGLHGRARAATPDELLAAYVEQDGAPASAERGQAFFTTAHGRDPKWTCAASHGAVPTRDGKDAMAARSRSSRSPRRPTRRASPTAPRWRTCSA